MAYRLSYYVSSDSNTVDEFDVCVPNIPDSPPFYVGYRRSTGHEPGDLANATWMGTCAPKADPPQVNVTGSVLTKDPEGPEDSRALSGARYELWYRGKAGAGTAVEWRPVKDGVGGSGNPVTGHLNEAGEYNLNFIYPQDYKLPDDGTLWEGCEDSGTRYLNSHACAASDIVLRVYARNSDDSALVRAIDGTDGAAANVELGRFFERAPGNDVHFSDEPAAFAYRAIHNVRDLKVSNSAVLPVTIQLNDSGDNRYSFLTRIANLDKDYAAYSTAEHEVGHALEHYLQGTGLVGAPDCNPHNFHAPSNQECARQEGFATFVAVAAEHSPGMDPLYVSTEGAANVERCTVQGTGSPYPSSCFGGSNVEGRVAAALWDLYDSTSAPVESERGFTDYSENSLDVIAATWAAAKPRAFDDFEKAWTAAGHVNDKKTMFLNTLSYAKLVDSAVADTTGSWSSESCGIASCVGANVLRSNRQATDSPSSVVWNVNVALSKGVYDLWVNIPVAGEDAAAVYQVTTATGTAHLTVDQQQGPGWIKIGGTEGLAFDDLQSLQVTLSNGSSTPYADLVADGLLIAPRS
ncbi:hypothetical protein ACFUJR_12050 [Streptomyces sp. NPDC057271]|uniref:golvesin C-terminal-like domain-containing protein n=1 Tax=unclassified Streptomyces TaxID=2593676 RepID=UPI0036337891